MANKGGKKPLWKKLGLGLLTVAQSIIRDIIPKVTVTIMILVVLVMSALILLTAFDTQRSTTISIEEKLTDAVDHIEETLPDGATKDRLTTFVDQLEAFSDKGMQESTVTFLFQVLSVALLTVGGYLVTQVQRRADETKKQADDAKKEVAKVQLEIARVKKAIRTLMKSNVDVSKVVDMLKDSELVFPIVSVLSTYLASAFQDSWLAKTASPGVHRTELVVQTRDGVTLFAKGLDEIVNNEEWEIEPRICDQMIDRLTKIKKHVNKLKEQGEDVDDILGTCDQGLELLFRPT